MGNFFGIDIGASSIKMVQFEKKKNQLDLISAGVVQNPFPNFNIEIDQTLVSLAELIKKLKSDSGISANKVVASLPERKVFTTTLELPQMKESELSQAVLWEAENVVPYPLSDVNLDWEILNEIKSTNGEKIKIILVAAPVALVDRYLMVFENAGLELLSLETDTLAQIRSVKTFFPNIFELDTLVVDLGAESTNLIALERGSFFSVRQVPTGGLAITRNIVSELNLDLVKAEEYKKVYGLSPQLEGKVASAIEPVLKIIVGEIKKMQGFFEESTKRNISLVYLTGGGALLPGLSEYLVKSLGVEVHLADCLSVFINRNQKFSFLKNAGHFFTVATGLALKLL